MPLKQISNGTQAFTTGATWGNAAYDNTATTLYVPLINGTGALLYEGDIVSLDATGTQAILPPGAASPTVIGTVGAPIASTFNSGTGNLSTVLGGPNPPTTSPVRTDTAGFTNGFATVTDTSAVASDYGKYITTPYNATTNANPQILQIIAVTAGTGYTVNTTFTGTTGTFTVTVGNGPQTSGPGYFPSTYAPNAVVPITTQGYGRVNVNGVTASVAGDGIASTSGSTVGARQAAGSYVTGTIIAVTLQAYAARDTTLTGLGITGHDSVTAIIGKM